MIAFRDFTNKTVKRSSLSALLFPLSFCIASCSAEPPKAEDIALQAAKAYYDQLLHGDYDAYVEGMLHGDSVPVAYKRQLVLNMQMFMEQQKRQHTGIDSISALRATADTASHAANAFLTFCFSDSTKEEVVVPMIEKDGIWYLR